MPLITNVYFFWKIWKGQYWYPGIVLELKDSEYKYFSEKPGFFLRNDDNTTEEFPPLTDDRDVVSERWPMIHGYELYSEHVVSLYKQHKKDYHTWARSVKSAVEWIHDYPTGRENILVRQGRDMQNSKELLEVQSGLHKVLFANTAAIVNVVKKNARTVHPKVQELIDLIENLPQVLKESREEDQDEDQDEKKDEN